MARYIDAEEFFDGFCIFAIGQDENFIKAVETVLEDTPTADVAEVKHGYWKKSQFSGRSGFYSVRDVICSECGIYSTFLQHEIRPDYYCPNCGAKMDGGKEDV